MEIYNAGQFNVIIPYVLKTPKTLILGGPADGNEAQCAVKQWPDIKVYGFEPSNAMMEWQLKNGWPDSANIYRMALSDVNGISVMRVSDRYPRGTSLMMDRPGKEVPVSTITLNEFDKETPLRDCILWLDIEGWEYQALCGASNLFSRGDVLAVNVEIIERRTEATKQIEEFFESVNFKLAHTWNIHSGSHHDRIYTPSGKYE